jgi:DNA-binding transcriptional regulator GbsR (MarR family)
MSDISVVTEITDMHALTPVQEKFVLHWGEMGTRWGINRTVAQVHALLFISARPIPADEIVETLSVARSNVSTSLKELQGWGIVRVVHVIGDRRDHFESMRDVWEMFRVIAEERKRREIDPTLALLRECMADVEKLNASADPISRERLGELLNFFETMTGWYDQMRKVPTSALLKAVKLGDSVFKFLGAKSR